MVSGYFLNLVKQQTASFFTSTCTIQRRPAALDDYGFGDGGWATEDEDIPCRILPIPPRGNQDMVGAGEEGRAFFRLILPVGTDLVDGDRVLIGDLIYEMLQMEDVQTDAAFLAAKIARLENG